MLKTLKLENNSAVMVRSTRHIFFANVRVTGHFGLGSGSCLEKETCFNYLSEEGALNILTAALTRGRPRRVVAYILLIGW